MPYDFDAFIDRTGTHSARWTLYEEPDKNRLYGDDTIFLSSADMDFPCSDAIRAELQKVVDYNLYGYTILTHKDGADYFDAVRTWFRKRRGWTLERENIFYVPGSMSGARNALMAFTKPNDGVIINRPVYGPFTSVIQGCGRKVVNNPLCRDDNGYYTIDFNALEQQASNPNTTAYLLCSPHNPVGRVWAVEELTMIHDICRRHHVTIISDEVHSDFVWGERKFCSIAQLTGGEGIVTCTGFGKTFNLAALSPANVIITDKQLLAGFSKQVAYMMTTPFTIAATKGACLSSDDWLQEVCAYLESNIDAALDFLHDRMPKAKCLRPEGGYMLWLDLRDYGLSDEELHHRIYGKAQVILEDGTAFDPKNGHGFQRACIPTQRTRMLQALNRIAEVLE